MSKRLEFSYVKSQIESTGYTLLSDTYKSVDTKLKLICPEGHEFEAKYHNFITLGTRCPTCNNLNGFKNNKNTFASIKASFEKEGYTLITPEYKNNRQKLETVCPKGHSWTTSYHAFLRGNRCKTCYAIKRNWSFEPKLSNHEKFNGVLGVDYVECAICGYRCVSINKRHLETNHNITKEEYVKLYPDAITCSEKKKEVQANISRGNKNNLGRKNSEETRRKISEAHKGKKGFKPSKETLEKASRTRRKVLLEKYGVENVAQIPHVREIMSKNAVGRLADTNNKFGGQKGCQGHFFSRKNNKDFFYRSSYELKYMKLLEESNSVFDYETEPFYIPYLFEGITHRYVPDFLINNLFLVEVKPIFMLEDEKTIAKTSAGNVYAREHNLKYSIVTTKDIDSLLDKGQSLNFS